MFRHSAIAWIVVSLSAVGSAQEYRWEKQTGKAIALRHKDQVLWQFNYGSEAPKPYFHPIALPGGRCVTWNQPPDHIWHHGLWFSWKYLNGVNYWEPDRSGKPAGRTSWSDVAITTNDDYSARITMRLAYAPPATPPVLTEQRAIEISSPAADGELRMDWRCHFTAGREDVVLDRTPLPGQPGGLAWGGYAGLSIRLARDLTERGADSTDGAVDFNNQSRYRGKAKALDYHGLLLGQPLGVAMIDHPGNLNHPSPWYVIRDQPMSYFSPAVICYGPHTLKAGESMKLQYRVIVHPGRWNAERLQKEFEEFASGHGPD